MASQKLYREDALQMLFADSDSEWEYLPFGNDDRPSNNRASPSTSLHAQWCCRAWRDGHEAPSSDPFEPLPNGDGVAGVDVVLVSIGEALRC